MNSFPSLVKQIAAPNPSGRVLHQPSCHRVCMHVKQFLLILLVGIDIEVIEPGRDTRLLPLLLAEAPADFGQQRVLARFLPDAQIRAVGISEAWTVQSLPGAPLIIVNLGKVTVGRHIIE